MVDIDPSKEVISIIPQENYVGGAWFDEPLTVYTVQNTGRMRKAIDQGKAKYIENEYTASGEPVNPDGYTTYYGTDKDFALEYDGDAEELVLGDPGSPSDSMRVPKSDGTPRFDTVEAQSISIKEEPIVNVKAWGAEGDGETIDLPAIQDALDYLKSNGGGTLFFPRGVYLVDKGAEEGPCLDFRDTTGITICGVGSQSVIKAADGAAADTEYGLSLIYPGPEWHIHNITLDGNRANQGTVTDAIDGGNVINAGPRGNMHDCWSINSTGDGVEMMENDCRVHNNYFKNNEEQDVHAWGKNITISDNTCIGCAEDGSIRVFNSDAKGQVDVTGLKIVDNLIVNPDTRGISIIQSNQVTIEPDIRGNTIINAGNTTSEETASDEEQKEAIFAQTVVRPQIRNNLIINPVDHGIEVTTTNSSSPRIRNNHIRGAGRFGIYVYGADDSRITGNTVEECQEVGIVIQNESGSVQHRHKIAGNEVINNNLGQTGSAAIRVAPKAGIDNVLILDNDIETTPDASAPHVWGIKAYSGGNFEVRGNRFRGTYNGPIDMSGTYAKVGENNPRLPLSSPPSSPDEGDEYLDDGTNTASGTAGVRAYLGGTWVDAYTA